MNIKEFKVKIFKEALKNGFEDCELYYQKSISFNVNIYKGDIEKYQNNFIEGLSFRGIYNGTMGYVYTEKIDNDIIEMLIKSAIQNAEIIEQTEKEFIYEGDVVYPDVEIYYDKINDITVTDKIEAAKSMEKAVIEYNQCIKSSNSCLVGNGEDEIYISNTKGLEVSQKSNYIIAYVSATAEKYGQTKSAGETWIGTDWTKFNPIELGQKAGKRVMEYMGSKSIQSGKYPVILKNETFADLITAFVGNFYAENVQKGFSLLNGKLNTKVASEKVTLLDTPLLEGGFATSPFDSEGVGCYDKSVIENGILKTFLYNIKAAEKDKVKSTGNGFKSSYKSTVTTAASNFYIKPSDIEYDTLIQQMKEGIVITELAGLHSGTNSVSGDFSLAADGFLIENGKTIRPIEQITIAGNFYEVIQDIVNVGNDIFFNLPSSSGAIGSPSVFVKNINISGI